MKRLSVKLNLTAAAPLLDIVKAAADGLCDRPAVPLCPDVIEEDLREILLEELLHGQRSDLARFLSLFDHDFFSDGTVVFHESNAEPILRACAAVRLHLWSRYLKELTPEQWNSESADPEDLDPAVKSPQLCFFFLTSLQELILAHLTGAAPVGEGEASF